VIQFGAEQMLQTAFGVSASAIAIIAGVFLLVLQATRRRRGLGWFWGWAFLSAALAVLAIAQTQPRFETWLAFAATCMAIASGSCGVAGAFGFRNQARMPAWAAAALVAAALCALYWQWRADLVSDIAAVEIPLMVSLVLQAVAMFPMARTSRMSGLQTACAVEIILALLMGRTILSSIVLALHGRELNEIYWTIEMGGGLILAFVLAIGELVALLDEIRVELESSNAALNHALERLEVAAKLDPLTGLYNRYAFYTLVNEFAAKQALNGSIAIIDLNGLKRINDTYGHHAGDRALLSVAMRLQEAVRQSDFVFRWGGDEFVVLLLGMSTEGARERMTHIPMPAPLELPEHKPIALTVSWGVAPLEPDVDAALRAADAQLYAQKRLFRGIGDEVADR
jgi:diguanylate cyclase (GGDEF)-like protein